MKKVRRSKRRIIGAYAEKEPGKYYLNQKYKVPSPAAKRSSAGVATLCHSLSWGRNISCIDVKRVICLAASKRV